MFSDYEDDPCSEDSFIIQGFADEVYLSFHSAILEKATTLYDKLQIEFILQLTEETGNIDEASSIIIGKCMYLGREIHSDFDGMVFKAFIKYLYSNDISDEVTMTQVLSLRAVGIGWNVESLAEECQEWILKNISLDNCAKVYFDSRASADMGLSQAVLERINGTNFLRQLVAIYIQEPPTDIANMELLRDVDLLSLSSIYCYEIEVGVRDFLEESQALARAVHQLHGIVSLMGGRMHYKKQEGEQSPGHPVTPEY